MAKVAGFFLRAIRRNWRLVPLPLLIGLCLSAGAGTALEKKSWESTGVMLYTPAPVPEAQKSLYPQPDVPTLVSLTKSPALLESLRDEFGLTVPLAALEKTFKVTAPRNVTTVTVSVRWAEAEMAARMVNRLMERFIDQVRDQRHRRAGEHLTDYEARLADSDARYTKTADAHQQFFRTHNLPDAKTEVETLRREMDALLTARAAAQRTERVASAQREQVRKEMESVGKKEAEKSKEFDVGQETLADNRRRQERLRELIDDEKVRRQAMTELESKRKEFQRVSELRGRGAAAQSEVDTIAKDIELLTTRLTDNDKVKQWKSELDNLDKMVVPKESKGGTGSPIIQQLLVKQLDIDLQLIGVQKEMFEADRGLADCRRRQEELNGVLARSDGLQKEMEGLVAERNRLTEQVGLFRRLRDQKAGEFAIVSPATTAPHPTSSTRKLWLIGGLALSLFASAGRVCRREWLDTYHGGRRAAERAGIPVLAHLGGDTESERRAATAVRRWVPEYGGVILLCEDQPGERVARLTRRFAARDERVLVVDITPGRSAESRAGLYDLLRFRASSWEDLTEPGPVPGIDVLPAGPDGDSDALASHLMREFLETVRKRYSFTLVIGPWPTELSTLEILAPYVGGALLSLGPQTATQAVCGASALRSLFGDRVRVVTYSRTPPVGGKASPAMETTRLNSCVLVG